MRFFIKLLLLLFFPFYGNTQELEIGINNYSNPGYYSTYTFNKRYNPIEYTQFSLHSTAYYALKNVKKMEVYDHTGSTLYFLLELDSLGKTVRSGTKSNHYFTVVENFTDEKNGSGTICKYFEKENLMRIDTNFYKEFTYKNADTSISFGRRTYITYKKGALINEQNDYYNETYLNKEVIINNSFEINIQVYDKKGNLVSEKQDNIYLKKKLKTDYDTSTLYLCKTEVYDDGFYATSDSGRNEILFEKITKHPYAKQWRKNDKKDCFTDGECFHEPSSLMQSMWCGSAMYRQNEYYSSHNYGYTQNENGLHENFFTDYFPPDTSKVIPQPVDSIALTNSVLTISPYPFQNYQRRMSTPIRTINYVFRYEYFEKPK